MKMRSKIITVVLTITAMGIGSVMAFASAADPAKTEVPTASTCMPVWSCSSADAPTTTTSSTTAPQLVPATSIVRPAIKAERSTTTTSEVPPRLTAEQEATIAKVQPCTEISQYGCTMGELASGTPAGEIDPSVPSTDAEIQWCINTHQKPGECKLPESEGMSDENATDYNLPNS
jgi:hypothetical protein